MVYYSQTHIGGGGEGKEGRPMLVLLLGALCCTEKEAWSPFFFQECVSA